MPLAQAAVSCRHRQSEGSSLNDFHHLQVYVLMDGLTNCRKNKEIESEGSLLRKVGFLARTGTQL
jgi:hypothetical protein